MNLTREYNYLSSVARTFWRLRRIKREGTRIFADIVEEWADKTPQAPAVFYRDREIGYRRFDEGANRFADWARQQGIERGDVVALFLENCPEYLMAWIGLNKLGAVAALINCNLKGAPLAHSIAIAHAKLAIVGANLCPALAEVARAIPAMPVVWSLGGAVPGAKNLDAALAAASPARPDKRVRKGLVAKDNALYIYTSGTTGMPKAANFSHFRMLFMMYGFAGALKTKASDRTYVALPLYHATGGICAVGMMLTAGGAVIIKKRFSVHEFWPDIRQYGATFFAYVGELCRYLLNQPADVRDGVHHLRGCTGNGLRPEIWRAFKTRFRIPRIVEFYGATEGNVSMLNYANVVGAVGRVPGYMRGLFPIRIVRFDVAGEAPVRDGRGFCIECAPGEVGEAVGGISERPGRSFEGYTAPGDTQKKILRDVFKKGDVWFRTGDLLKRDARGYFYFVDRIGDTFRWKGENVATSEVAEALSVVPGILEVNVYGVDVPGCDGRAGMAALVTEKGFDPAGLAAHLDLPHYARPLFLRLRPELEITGTFKLKKADLVKQGFDPGVIGDPLYWFDSSGGSYRALTQQAYGDIVAGKTKF
ncbi:MAG TPA: long-chain-acyl-CoA synthetase [Rhizomicrobium sp.]|nr:long-chain-acyl-CoA synthetase [Rhizomicrobium sp.]